MTPRRIAALLAVAAALLAGCGSGGSETDTAATGAVETQRPEPFLQIDFPGKVGPEDAGFVLAHRLGYFPRNRVHVWWVSPSHPARPPMYLEQELVDAAMIHEPQLILAREDGKPLVAFGSIIPHPTMAMIWLKGSGIDSVADLKGKTIAFPGIRFQRNFLEAILNRAGLTLKDVKLKEVGYYLASELIKGRADAIFGGSMSSEGKLLEADGFDPVVTPVTKLGIPDYEELVWVARSDRYAAEPELFRRLVRGTTQGNASVSERPGVATKGIVHLRKGEIAAGPTQAGVEEMAPRFSRSGRVDPAKLKRLIDWMYEEGMIKRRMPVSEVLAEP